MAFPISCPQHWIPLSAKAKEEKAKKFENYLQITQVYLLQGVDSLPKSLLSRIFKISF